MFYQCGSTLMFTMLITGIAQSCRHSRTPINAVWSRSWPRSSVTVIRPFTSMTVTIIPCNHSDHAGSIRPQTRIRYSVGRDIDDPEAEWTVVNLIPNAFKILNRCWPLMLDSHKLSRGQMIDYVYLRWRASGRIGKRGTMCFSAHESKMRWERLEFISKRKPILSDLSEEWKLKRSND